MHMIAFAVQLEEEVEMFLRWENGMGRTRLIIHLIKLCTVREEIKSTIIAHVNPIMSSVLR